jgi:hypothetical protein
MPNVTQGTVFGIVAVPLGCSVDGQSSHLMRYAGVRRDQLVFPYEGDW